MSLSSLKRYAKLAEQGRPLTLKKRPGSRPKMGQTARRLLETGLEGRPVATLSERREFLKKAGGVSVSDSTVSRMLKRLGWSRKKRSLGARERDEFLRAAWRLVLAGRVDVERLVFVDEMGTNVSLCPIYAWSRRGGRAHAKAPRNSGARM